MQKRLNQIRHDYFCDIANHVQSGLNLRPQFVVLTHILTDRPELLTAISKIGSIALVIGIPYSIDESTLSKIKPLYKVITPSLAQLKTPSYLTKVCIEHLSKTSPVMILEIGGYFAPALELLYQELGARLLGIIEDTEAGHRAYERVIPTLPCPVISVARSRLKDMEDFLVGASCLYSTEKLIRKMGYPIEGMSSLVLGFGKIGKGLASALSRRCCPVSIYDIDPIRQIQALSMGYRISKRKLAFQESKIIFGATGKCSIDSNNFQYIKSGAILVSCSSKAVEFELPFLKKNYQRDSVIDGIERYHKEDQYFYLAGSGYPINFRDGAVIGPVLALVQAEIILAISELAHYRDHVGMFETCLDSKLLLAKQWLEYFCDNEVDHYVSLPRSICAVA